MSKDTSKLSSGAIADLADSAANDGNHVEAERLYLLAAAKASAHPMGSNHANTARWDKAAARQRRLAQLAKERPE